ncbi:hypothetical protein NW752_009471 [Fusarium irregulare]|uniref:Uncharacterized protein n=1 Tax=Fusarium irregulare TaxID=2494466 RepID=A0A9W8PD36_9HYPO|nr:hypothetical protein NW766_012751 [Fusarium irregulare]KAJ4009172.1 hypothetical protein NW752_009471 [Fusarium irregulare]
MSAKRLITDLPTELRQKIFAEYFKVQGGYAYDVESDKLRNAADSTLIDLALMYTCRSIANDCKQLPLTVNTVHFSTVYLEDWRNLAACFNAAATYYRVLQENILLHLARLITPEMYQQIEEEFPTFQSKFEETRREHIRFWHNGEDPHPAIALPDTKASDDVQYPSCGFVKEFFEENISRPCESPLAYRGFAYIDQNRWKYRRSQDASIGRMPHLEVWDFYDNKWDDSASGEVHRCSPRLLALIADHSPKEFANRVYLHLPHWRETYPAETFLDMKLGLEWWAMPSGTELSIFLDRLGAPDYLWRRPNMWSYDHLKFVNDLTNAVGSPFSYGQFQNPPVDFEIRVREKCRFSAAAAAIRFIKLLPDHQRKQLRTISLYEDLPAVNLPSLHGQGLVPLLKENTKLKVQRRVSVVDCIMNLYPTIYYTDHYLLRGQSDHYINGSFAPSLSCWLLDTLSVANAGTPSDSFSLLLDSGPDADICTEAFEQIIHGCFARARAWKHGLETGTITHESNEAIRCLTRRFACASELGFEEAVMQLVNQSSPVLRCNFNPGFHHDHQQILDNVRDKCFEEGYDAFKYWFKYFFKENVLGRVNLPDHFRYVERMSRVYEIQSGDQYLESQGRELSHVRTVEEMLKHRKERERQERAARGYIY